MSVIGRRAEGVARHSRRRPARDAGIKTASKRKRAPRRPQIADKPSPSGGFLFFNGVMLKTPMPTQHELEMV
ncbi:hypothetical protein, partial [Burkholderia pseudomallei]|uniref:hypothetical protein n=1 Tax=Burkholderia pseudomallei TaxID=28450 RepID=UPI0019D35137